METGKLRAWIFLALAREAGEAVRAGLDEAAPPGVSFASGAGA